MPKFSTKILGQIRSINPRLLTYIIVTTLVIGALVAAKVQADRFNADGKYLTKRKYELEQLIESHDTWKRRADWIQYNIPRYDVNFDSEAALNEYIKQSLITADVEILSVNKQKASFSDHPPTHKHFRKSTTTVVVIGDEEDIVLWMHSLQAPEAFISIDRTDLEVVGYKTLRCAVNISIWYDTVDGLAQAVPAGSFDSL